MSRQQWARIVQLALEEFEALRLVPFGVAADTEVGGDFVERRDMPPGILADVQAHQEQAEGVGAAQAVEQRAVGDRAQTAADQRVVAQQQRFEQLAVVVQHRGARGLAVLQRRSRPVAGGEQTRAQLAQQRAVGLGGVADPFAQRRTGLVHGQVGDQSLDVAQVQLGGDSPCLQQHLGGHLRRDIGVAVAVAAHPRGKANRCRLQRQTGPAAVMQQLVDAAQEARQGTPQRMLDHRKAPLGLVHRGRLAATDLFGMPDFGQQPAQLATRLGLLPHGQIGMILRSQTGRNIVVLLDQGAPRHLGRMGGEHQLDIQTGDLLRQTLRTVTGGLQALEHFAQHPFLERQRLVRPAATDAVVLLGDVGQIEELVERPRHRQQLVLGQGIEGLRQLLRAGQRAAPRRLGPLADAFDLVEKVRAALGAKGLTQQLAQQVDVLAQARIDFRHLRSPSSVPCLPGTACLAARDPRAV
ncbi:hypothetical protein D3C78_434370 [compost metagenome]